MLEIKVGFLFLAIFFTLVNTSRIFYKNPIPFINVFLQTIGITGFVVMHWFL